MSEHANWLHAQLEQTKREVESWSPTKREEMMREATPRRDVSPTQNDLRVEAPSSQQR